MTWGNTYIYVSHFIIIGHSLAKALRVHANAVIVATDYHT